MDKNIPKNIKAEIDKYINEDIDTLYSIVDLIRSSKEPGLMYLPGNEVSRAKAYLEKFKNKLKIKICEEWLYCKKRNDPELQDSVNLVAGVADIISSISFGVPPVLVSTILVKKGLNKLCNCDSEENKK